MLWGLALWKLHGLACVVDSLRQTVPKNTWTYALLLTPSCNVNQQAFPEANCKIYFGVGLLGSRVQIPPKVWMSVFACRVGSGLLDKPLIRSEDSYRLCVCVCACERARARAFLRVTVCDLEISERFGP